MKGKSTRNLCLVLWTVISAVLLYCVRACGFNCVLITAIGCIIGIIGIGRIYNSFSGWIVLDIGIAFLIYPISKICGYNLRYGDHIKEVAIGLSFLIAMQLFFDDYFRNKKAKKRCTVPFEAKCISFAPAGVSSYVPIYRYHIDGKTNTFYGNNLSSVNPKLGDIITVFVNKKNEKDIYCPTAKAILMIRYIIGLIILSFSTSALVIL